MSETLDPIAIDQQTRLGKRSAFEVLKPIKRFYIFLIITALLLFGWFGPLLFGLSIFALSTLNFVLLFFFRVHAQYLFSKNAIAEEQKLYSSDLSSLTVLIPLKNEGAVIHETFQSIIDQDFPKDKLEVIIIVEEIDHFTLDHIAQIELPSYFMVLQIPKLLPFTKGRALCHGVNAARNIYITIIDAESRPEPGQFRKAMEYFEKHEQIDCLQAKVQISNGSKNLLTALFASEYFEWFESHLPHLALSHNAFGLGGNSFYIKREKVLKVGGWDPFNVTEDAELSVRLLRSDFKFQMLSSYTLEVCPQDVKSWLYQRIRWCKGLLITQLTHLFNRKQMPGGAGFAFWTRMFLGTSLPISTVYVFFFLIINPQVLLSWPWLEWTLWGIFGLTVGISFWADRRNLKKIGISNNPFTLLLFSVYYMLLYIIASLSAYYGYFVAPLDWNKTNHDL